MFRWIVLHAPCSGDPSLEGLKLVVSGVTLRSWWEVIDTRLHPF